MNPRAFLKEEKVLVNKELFGVVKAKNPDPQAFANIMDHQEITVVIDQSKLNPSDIIAIEADWRLLTFEMKLPFELVGFLAIIAEALAKAKASIFALSTYSTDHILVKDKDLEKSLAALAELGCNIYPNG